MTTLDEGELVQALVELATLLRLFERVLAERGDYARMQRELVATRAIRWGPDGRRDRAAGEDDGEEAAALIRSLD